MTRFGHKLNYVINTFVKRTPDFYKDIASFGFQTYFDKLSVRKFRIALTKLRVSSHRLQIEAGRWSKPNSTPRNERLCRLNKLEDEFHLLLECTLYNQLRIN